MTNPPLLDVLGRPLGSLRISVTDRCNMRCQYCMPEEEYVWLPRTSILTFEETVRLTTIFAGLGVRKLRLTGGEPLLRHELSGLVRQLAGIPGIEDLALTTNAILLATAAEPLRAAGLSRVTISLDTLRPDRLEQFARSSKHREILNGVTAARQAGFTDGKINTVVIRGFNDDELVDLVEFGRSEGYEVRFIEYMDVGGATRWRTNAVVSQAEILERLRAHYGEVTPLEGEGPAPADRYALRDGTTVGIIASTTAPFCRRCDRSRLTADGTWFLCLYADQGVDLKGALRTGASDDELTALIVSQWQTRTDRGAELRRGLADRRPLYQLEGLRADPHREMHTRGG